LASKLHIRARELVSLGTMFKNSAKFKSSIIIFQDNTQNLEE